MSLKSGILPPKAVELATMYLFIFPDISNIIRRGFERFLVQKINV